MYVAHVEEIEEKEEEDGASAEHTHTTSTCAWEERGYITSERYRRRRRRRRRRKRRRRTLEADARGFTCLGKDLPDDYHRGVSTHALLRVAGLKKKSGLLYGGKILLEKLKRQKQTNFLYI